MQLAELPYLDLTLDLSVTSEGVRALRASHWMVRSGMGYAVLRYGDCAAMLRDERLQQASRVILGMRGVTEGPLVEWWTGTMLNMDGADHSRLRRLVAKAFTPPMVERLRPFFRATAERLVAEFSSDGRCEFMSAFCEPYPLEGICEMLGVPHDRRSAFHGWASDLGLIFSHHIGEPATRERAETALLALYACANDVIADRRGTPGDDLVSALVAAEAEGERLTDAELRSMVVGLIFAGNDTTRNQLALGVIAFSEHCEQWTRLRDDAELAPRAVDEMMRLQPTISIVSRIASQEVTYHDVAFPAGTLFQLFLASANADEDVFGPAPFDITVERPAQHLTFSGGIHRCLGMWLARAEMEEALAVLASRFESIQRDGEPMWQVGLGIDGPTTLPLRFR